MYYAVRANTGKGKRDLEWRTNNLQPTSKPFPFLRLPAEIRNQIYRLVLLRENVSTEVLKVRPWEILGDEAKPDEVTVGTIRCKSYRAYTIGFQISILRANRQIYHEACSIFNLENFWTIVRVNKAGFGKGMKDCGFPIITADDLWRHFRFPVMKVTVKFPSLHDQGKCGAFLIATFHLKHLIRVLWTAKGSSEIEVMIQVQPPLTNNSPSEHHLLQPFFQLVSIKKVIVLGVSNKIHIAELTSAITTRIGINQAYIVLMASIRNLRGCINAQRWRDAVVQAERHNILLADCRTVFGKRIFGIEPDPSVNTFVARRRAAAEIFLSTALDNAEITLHGNINTSAICFATAALVILSHSPAFHPTIAANPNILVPSPYKLLPITGTITSLNHFKCYILCIRARAYMGNRQAEPAMLDIEMARNLKPASVMLASVSEDWQARFGSVTSSAPTPPGIT